MCFRLPASDEAVETFLRTQLPDPDGTQINFAQLRGKTVVVNFWAPWCGPCVEEMPDLNALHKEYTGRKVEFVGIGIDSANNIQQFIKKIPVSYPLAVAGFAGTELAQLWQRGRWPALYSDHCARWHGQLPQNGQGFP